MNRDLHNNVAAFESVRPVVHTSDVNGEEVDLQDCDSAEIVISIGAIVATSGDSFLTLEESDVTGTGFTAVADADIIGVQTAVLLANTEFNFGYKGAKRFIRAVLDTGAATSVACAAMIIKGNLFRKPDDFTVSS